MLAESGDEEESDQIVSQVLDEIGIEMTGKVTGLIIACSFGNWLCGVILDGWCTVRC